jgi:multisubunit Na+/H+ antiporter MnhB subunit
LSRTSDATSRRELPARTATEVRRELERKASILNLVSTLALLLILVMAVAIAFAPGLGTDRLAVLALAVALVAFLVPTAEAHRRNAIEAADALDALDGRSEAALWLQVERRIPRLLPRLWPGSGARAWPEPSGSDPERKG